LIFWCIWIQRIVLISIRFSSYSAVLWRISASFTLPTAVNNPGNKSTSLINYRLAEKKKHYRAIYCSAIVQNENSPLTWLFLRYFILCFVRFRNDVPRFCSRTFYGSLNQFRFLSHTFLANFFYSLLSNMGSNKLLTEQFYIHLISPTSCWWLTY